MMLFETASGHKTKLPAVSHHETTPAAFIFLSVVN
jgi:hypothetical protein